MPLAASHSLPHKKDRKSKKAPTTAGLLFNKYYEVDRVIDNIYVDIANGVSRSDVLQKIQQGEFYGNKPMKYRQAVNYWDTAMNRFAADTDIEHEKLRNIFFTRYESLFEEAVKKGDIFNARNVLDSMSRIFGIEKKTPDTAIMINSEKEGGITVNFGFNNDNKEEANGED